MAVEAFAPAKINLTLHVTGRRADGYHLLDSLVAFAGIGDRITLQPDTALTLSIGGPMASGLPAGEDNLVLRAAHWFRDGSALGAAIALDKHLPAAAGLGGGSADAAAALRGLARLWDRPLPSPESTAVLGADVPVCLAGQVCRMRGIGESLTALPPLPPVWVVLVNPGVAVSTAEVFRALGQPDNPPMPENLPDLSRPDALISFLDTMRNDLQVPAIAAYPVVAEVLDALARQPGCGLARMSGSGASCFGLFLGENEAAEAAQAVVRANPQWWVRAAPVVGAEQAG